MYAIIRILLTIICLLFFFIIMLNTYFYFMQRSLVYFPNSSHSNSPSLHGLEYNEIFLSTISGKVHGWEIPNPERKSYLLYFSGNAGNIGYHVDKYKLLFDIGFHIFAFDYPGFGKSEGQPSKKSIMHSLYFIDEYLSGVREGNCSLMVHGFSLGGAVAGMYVSEYYADAVIFESTFTSINNMAGIYYPYIAASLINNENYDNLKLMQVITQPMLFFHSRTDEIIPFSMGKKLYEFFKGPKFFQELQGGHNVNAFVNKDNYIFGYKRLFDIIEH